MRADLLPELLARAALAARPVTGGRAVPEREERPTYPRYRSINGIACDLSYPYLFGVHAPTPGLARAEAARYRARVAQAACKQRELKLAAKRAERVARKASR